MRTLSELIDTGDPAWPDIHSLLTTAPVVVEIIPADPAYGARCLHALQVTTRSALGALAYHTGGVLVDHGWLRVLGGGGPHLALPGLDEANDLSAGAPDALLVGVDVLGGRFEVNGADPVAIGRPGEPGQVCYFAPDTLEWEPHVGGHADWLDWITVGGTTPFYDALRWPGWETGTRRLRPDQGFSIYPPLWSAQAQDDLANTSRAAIPLGELFAMQAAISGRVR